MNYLAHAYLSFNLPEILIGNMISDFVKGKNQYCYSPSIQKGIQLHRAIDQFTDTHAYIKGMKKLFIPFYGLYAGVFTDVVCDYFLANDKKEFASAENLHSFTLHTYQQIENEPEILPQSFQTVFSNMKHYNWLYNYQFEWAIQKSFLGIAARAKYLTEVSTAFEIFKDNIEVMRPYYNDFFPLLKDHAAETLKRLVSNH